MVLKLDSYLVELTAFAMVVLMEMMWVKVSDFEKVVSLATVMADLSVDRLAAYSVGEKGHYSDYLKVVVKVALMGRLKVEKLVHMKVENLVEM